MLKLRMRRNGKLYEEYITDPKAQYAMTFTQFKKYRLNHSFKINQSKQ